MKLSGFRNQSGLKAHQSNLDTTVGGTTGGCLLSTCFVLVRGEDSSCHDAPRNSS